MASALLLLRGPVGRFRVQDSQSRSNLLGLQTWLDGHTREKSKTSTCINWGDEGPRIVGPGVPRVPLGPRHLHGCDGRLWLSIEELASRPRRRRCRTHLRHTRLIPRTHQPAVNELIHQDQETPPVTNPLGATSLPPSDLPSKVITKWSPRAKLEAQLATHDLWWLLTTDQHKKTRT